MNDESTWQQLTVQRLKAIKPTDTGISKAARIRALLPAIDEAMARDITQTDILNALAETGLIMTLDELRTTLYRARKRLKKESKPDAQAATPTVVPAPKATVSALPLPAAAQQNTNPNAPPRLNWQAERDNNKTF